MTYALVRRGVHDTVHLSACPRLALAAQHQPWTDADRYSPLQLVRALPALAPWRRPCHVCLPSEQVPIPQQLDIASAAEPVFETRDQALRRAQDSASRDWLVSAVTAIEAIAATGRDFQAFDLIELGLPEPDHPCRWGAVFGLAARRGLITSVGSARSKRPTTKGSLMRVWRGTEAVK